MKLLFITFTMPVKEERTPLPTPARNTMEKVSAMEVIRR